MDFSRMDSSRQRGGKESGAILFAALVPHRDAAAALEKRRQSLFAAGLAGAFAFPAVIPLAILKRPLAEADLKSFAAELRRVQGSTKFTPGSWITSFPFGKETDAPIRLYGPVYHIPASGLRDADPCAPTVLAAAVITPNDMKTFAEPCFQESARKTDEAPAQSEADLAFRAAALANISVLPAKTGENGYSFIWETGKLFWLPNPASGKSL
ncbi:hypothetical protein FACS1894161_4080 [Spirochaetia bacterium]|nr:hypothetical protein FACS1894161_4080 [Spirochaetia bacterium]